MDDSSPSSIVKDFFLDYWDIGLGIFLSCIAIYFHNKNILWLSAIFSAFSIAAISVTISEIAEILAERLGEPYGSFVLTFSAVAVEILLLFMILNEKHAYLSLSMVKSGIISAVIVDMNVLLGLAVFVGGLTFKEQQHNQDTSSSYTTILLVSASALLVPSILSIMNDNTQTLQKASILISGVLFSFYLVLLIFQTKTHSHFFKATARSRIFRLKRRLQKTEEYDDQAHIEHYIFDRASNIVNFISIFSLILFIGLFAEIFASDGMVIFNQGGLSVGLAGLVIAIISVSPEIFTAIKAAKNDQIQRVVNIAMGASTVSILLTVPILMALSYANSIKLTLDFNSLQIGALLLTIILAWKTTDDGETNYLEGISHLMFFLSYAIIAAFY